MTYWLQNKPRPQLPRDLPEAESPCTLFLALAHTLTSRLSQQSPPWAHPSPPQDRGHHSGPLPPLSVVLESLTCICVSLKGPLGPQGKTQATLVFVFPASSEEPGTYLVLGLTNIC